MLICGLPSPVYVVGRAGGRMEEKNEPRKQKEEGSLSGAAERWRLNNQSKLEITLKSHLAEPVSHKFVQELVQNPPSPKAHIFSRLFMSCVALRAAVKKQEQGLHSR